jgi:hypothetical protein
MKYAPTTNRQTKKTQMRRASLPVSAMEQTHIHKHEDHVMMLTLKLA